MRDNKLIGCWITIGAASFQGRLSGQREQGRATLPPYLFLQKGVFGRFCPILPGFEVSESEPIFTHFLTLALRSCKTGKAIVSRRRTSQHPVPIYCYGLRNGLRFSRQVVRYKCCVLRTPV